VVCHVAVALVIAFVAAPYVLAADYDDRVGSATAALPAPLRAAFEDSLAAASQAAAFVHGGATGAFVLAVISAASAVTVAICEAGLSRVTPEPERIQPAVVVAATRIEIR
jgi:hypothetical protein